MRIITQVEHRVNVVESMPFNRPFSFIREDNDFYYYGISFSTTTFILS